MSPEHRSQEKKIQSLKGSFSHELRILFAPGNRDGTRILNCFERTARQLNIRNFDALEVVSETACRGLATIEKKEEPIKSVTAWFRSIGIRIIKDQVKAEIRARKLIEKHSFHEEVSDSWVKLMLEEEGAAAYEAVMLLSVEDQEVLRLRFVEDMCYKDIQAYYCKIYNVSVKVETLRKRESRAVERLKIKFKEIYK